MINLVDFFKNKKFQNLVIYNFKGSWLSGVMKSFNAKVYISKGVVSTPSNMKSQISNLTTKLLFRYMNFQKFNDVFKKINPDIVFHLAAQSLVRKSYKNPYETWLLIF